MWLGFCSLPPPPPQHSIMVRALEVGYSLIPKNQDLSESTVSCTVEDVGILQQCVLCLYSEFGP